MQNVSSPTLSEDNLDFDKKPHLDLKSFKNMQYKVYSMLYEFKTKKDDKLKTF